MESNKDVFMRLLEIVEDISNKTRLIGWKQSANNFISRIVSGNGCQNIDVFKGMGTQKKQITSGVALQEFQFNPNQIQMVVESSTVNQTFFLCTFSAWKKYVLPDLEFSEAMSNYFPKDFFSKIEFLKYLTDTDSLKELKDPNFARMPFTIIDTLAPFMFVLVDEVELIKHFREKYSQLPDSHNLADLKDVVKLRDIENNIQVNFDFNKMYSVTNLKKDGISNLDIQQIDLIENEFFKVKKAPKDNVDKDAPQEQITSEDDKDPFDFLAKELG